MSKYLGKSAPARTQGAISVYGVITDTSLSNFEKELRLLHQQKSELDRINVWINSPGGKVNPALKMYRLLMQSNFVIPTTGIVIGEASSMASIVLQGCSVRTAHNDAIFTIHRTGHDFPLATSKKETRRYRKIAWKEQREVNEIYLSHAQCEMSELLALYNRNAHLNAKEACRFRIIDSIFSSIEEIPP